MKAYAELGSTLRSAREKAGRSISDVASDTGLPERYVVALEKGDMSDLPDLSYARLYLQSYARSLRLDPESMLAAWPSARSSVPEKLPREEARVRTKSRWPLVVLALLFFLVIGSMVYLMRDVPEPSGPQEIAERPTQVPARTVTEPASAGAPPTVKSTSDSLSSALSVTPHAASSQEAEAVSPNLLAPHETSLAPAVAEPIAEPPARKLTTSAPLPVSPFRESEPIPVVMRSLDVQVASQTWLVIEADGDTVVARVAARGEKVTAEARSDFRLTVTNPRDLKVTLDGKPLALSVRSNRPLIRHPLPGKDTP